MLRIAPAPELAATASAAIFAVIAVVLATSDLQTIFFSKFKQVGSEPATPSLVMCPAPLASNS